MEITINGKTINVHSVYSRRLLDELVMEVNALIALGKTNKALHSIKNAHYCGVYDMHDASRMAALVMREEE